MLTFLLMLGMMQQPTYEVNMEAPTFIDSSVWEPRNLTIVGPDSNDPMVRIDLKTGAVTFGGSYKPDATAEAFWFYLAGESPAKLRAEIAELKRQLEQKEGQK